MLRTITLTGLAALFAATAIPLAPPARAQIGNIFSDPPPRPPGAIPRGNQQPSDDEEEVPDLPQGRVLPAPNRPLPGQGVPPPGAVQSQPLAPPPGVTVIPQNGPPGIAVAPPQPGQGVAVAPPGPNPPPGLPPGQRQSKGVPGSPATLQPGDEVVTEPPAQKIVNKKASFSGLDKITGRIINFDEDIGETVQFGARAHRGRKPLFHLGRRLTRGVPLPGNRPFPAVFAVLTGSPASGGYFPTMSRARFAC